MYLGFCRKTKHQDHAISSLKFELSRNPVFLAKGGYVTAQCQPMHCHVPPFFAQNPVTYPAFGDFVNSCKLELSCNPLLSGLRGFQKSAKAGYVTNVIFSFRCGCHVPRFSANSFTPSPLWGFVTYPALKAVVT